MSLRIDDPRYADVGGQTGDATGLMSRYFDTGNEAFMWAAVQEAMTAAGIHGGNPFEQMIREDLAGTVYDYQTQNLIRKNAGLDQFKFGDVLARRMATGDLGATVNPEMLSVLGNAQDPRFSPGLKAIATDVENTVWVDKTGQSAWCDRPVTV